MSAGPACCGHAETVETLQKEVHSLREEIQSLRDKNQSLENDMDDLMVC